MNSITIKGLATIAQQPGPCLTLLVPGHHPGAPEGSQKTQLRTLVKNAQQQAAGVPAAWPTGFESPVEEIANSLAEAGGPGFAVYRTADSVASVSFEGCPAKSVLASHPFVMPLLESAFSAQELCVLGLSANHLRLFEYSDGTCRPLAVPAGIPQNLAAAGHAHHGSQGENATPSGINAGNLGGIRFGTGGDRENARDAMEHFCVAIDRGLRSLLDGRPLLLMGVKQEIAAYRRVSHYDSILQAEVDGNVETFTPARIAALAQQAALAEYRRQGLLVRNEILEMRDRARTAQDVHEALKAAVEGRVHKLCVRGGTEVIGPLEPALNPAGLPVGDLINAAVVETLRHGGEVYVLPPEQLAITESASAILRY